MKTRAGGPRRAKAPQKIPLQLLPEALASLTVLCPNCQFSFGPDWFKPRPEPIVPLKPNATPPDHPGRWVPTAGMISCTNCGGSVQLKYPVQKLATRCELCGDEAGRLDDTGRRRVCTYSLVGADEKLMGSVNAAVDDLKRALEPGRSPTDWSFHMLEMRSTKERKVHEVFRNWDNSKMAKAIDGLFRIVQETPNLLVFSISVTGTARAGKFDQLKHEAYIALLANVIDDVTSKRCAPLIFFDAEKRCEGSRVIQEWARRLFFDSQYCLLYAFLAKGIEIPEPQFIKQASRPCLELADFVSFVVARHHLDRWRGKVSQLAPERLGNVKYMSINHGGDLLFAYQTGFPWERFYLPSG
jgi:hypothetical protein